MKIAIISPYITSSVSPDYYASQRLNIATELIRGGDHVKIFTLNRSESRCREERVLHRGEHIDVKFLPSASPAMEKANFSIISGLRRCLLRDKWDIVQTSEDIQLSTIQAAAAKGNARLIIFQGINHYSFTYMKRLIMMTFDRIAGPWIRSRTDLVIAKTRKAEEFMRAKGYKRVITIPMGVNLDIFHPHPREEGRAFLKARGAIFGDLNLLYVGNLIPRRDLTTLFHAVRFCRDQGVNVALVVIGEGPEERSLRVLAKNLRIKDKVSFLNLIPNTAMPLAYSGADLFVFSPLYEIFGMVLMEAMACGLPVISTPVPAIMDILEKQETHGLATFPFREYRSLGGILLGLARDPARRKRMGKTNRRIAECYGWPSIAERIRAAYQVALQ